MIRIIESPREGMQGVTGHIPAAAKVKFINSLLKAGFDTVETGSIASPRLVPQMADSLEVLQKLDLEGKRSDIMFLVVNSKGAQVAATYDQIDIISYPFSFSPTFLDLNVRSTVGQSLHTTEEVLNLCDRSGKKAVIYISMAFGNPYGDPWSPDLLSEWVNTLYRMGVRTIPLSNVATEIDPGLISAVFSRLVREYPEVEFGLHLHTANRGWYEKVSAAWEAGCRRFDGVMQGWGGCPMAGKEMLGNLKTENLMHFADQNLLETGIDPEKFGEALRVATETYALSSLSQP